MDDPVLRVQSQLTDRDRLLLGWLYDHGVLTSFQIAHALFPSLDFCQRRLRTLHRLGLVARFRPQRAEGGSFPYHYVIDQLGAEVVAAGRDLPPPRRDHARTARRRWTASRTLTHRLGVNGFFTDLSAHTRTHPDTALTAWLPEGACGRVETFREPGDDPMILAYPPSIRPDAYGRWTENGRQVPFFLEYDTGGEALPVLWDKLPEYRHLFTRLNRMWPVLFWLPTAARERHLRRLFADNPPPVVVATAARDHATAADLCPAGPVWAVAGHDPGQRLRLIDLAGYAADLRTPSGTAP